MLKLLMTLLGPSWQTTLTGYVAAGMLLFVGLAHDLDDDKTNDTNWGEQGALILAALGLTRARDAKVSTEMQVASTAPKLEAAKAEVEALKA